MISRGFSNISKDELLGIVTEDDILYHYFNLKELPVLIESPLRSDKNPSFSIFKRQGKIFFKDFATKASGDIFRLLSEMWGTDFRTTIGRIYGDVQKNHGSQFKVKRGNHINYKATESTIQCKTRAWKKYDLDYWSSYGISLDTLKFGDVHPVSHIIVVKNNHRFIIPADKLSYCYVERKDNKVSLKIYQPLNKNGHKWYNKSNKSVWDLWTKLPPKGKKVIITSSRKDALCLWENTGIPSVSLQGEGYLPKPSVMEELKSRFDIVYVLYDNDFTNPDNPGRKDGEHLAKLYNLRQIEIPTEYGSKDPSDLFKNKGKKVFKQVIKKLIDCYSLSNQQ